MRMDGCMDARMNGWVGEWVIGGLSLSVLSSCSMQLSMEKAHTLRQIRGLSLFHLLHTTPREKAHSLSDWRVCFLCMSCT